MGSSTVRLPTRTPVTKMSVPRVKMMLCEAGESLDALWFAWVKGCPDVIPNLGTDGENVIDLETRRGRGRVIYKIRRSCDYLCHGWARRRDE